MVSTQLLVPKKLPLIAISAISATNDLTLFLPKTCDEELSDCKSCFFGGSSVVPDMQCFFALDALLLNGKYLLSELFSSVSTHVGRIVVYRYEHWLHLLSPLLKGISMSVTSRHSYIHVHMVMTTSIINHLSTVQNTEMPMTPVTN